MCPINDEQIKKIHYSDAKLHPDISYQSLRAESRSLVSTPVHTGWEVESSLSPAATQLDDQFIDCSSAK